MRRKRAPRLPLHVCDAGQTKLVAVVLVAIRVIFHDDFDVAKLGFGDHDLWIAATAIDRGAVLVSADPDFLRMTDVVDLEVEDWTRS